MALSTGYGTFIFFGAFATLSGVYTWFFVPETKGRTLEQMDEVFKTSIAQEDRKAKFEITQVICAEAYGTETENEKDHDLDMVESV